MWPTRLQMDLEDVFTVSANLAGLPAVSGPCGFTAGGLPIGMQLTGRPFDEATALRVADAYERDTDWSRRRSPFEIAGLQNCRIAGRIERAPRVPSMLPDFRSCLPILSAFTSCNSLQSCTSAIPSGG